MTDKSKITRRKYLGATAALGLTSVSGCMMDALNRGNKKNTYSEITGITVRKTPDGYNQNEDYFAVVSDDLQSENDIGRNEQIRLKIQATGMEQWRLRPSIFTTKIEPAFTSEKTKTIWLSEKGMERISAEDGMIVTALPFATSPNYETKDAAKENDEFIEQSVTSESNLLSCASSGGQIYQNTDLQALHVSSESSASSWITAGFDDRGRAHERWHVRPELINPESYNNVRFLIDEQEYTYGINFIGIPDTRKGLVLIGGLVTEDLQEKLAENIRAAFKDSDKNVTVRVVQSGRWSGTDTRNIINRFTESGDNGLQVAQTEDIHTNHWKKVANAALKTFKEETGSGDRKYGPN